MLTLALGPVAVQAQVPASTGARWTLEASVAAVGAPGEGGSNIAIGGTAPVVALRVNRALGPRWSLSVNAGYGQAAGARRDVYERPSGPTRIDTYDYRVLLMLAGVEYARPVARVEVVSGMELGWVQEGWRVASHVDPTGLTPPESHVDGTVAAGARLGLRYPLGHRIAITGQVRYLGGPGVSTAAPELGLRWAF